MKEQTMENEMKPVLLEDVKILWPNFEGKEDKFNRAGNRNFNIDLDLDVAEQMEVDGWNIRWMEPREEGDIRRATINCVVKYGTRHQPMVVMVTSGGQTLMNSETVQLLDAAEIRKADVLLNPYNWEVGGSTGIKAYVKTMYVTIEEDYLMHKYGPIGGISHAEG